jgi:hypothetical protein
MRRRHLKALSSDEFPGDGFRRSGTIGLPDGPKRVRGVIYAD